MSFNIGQIRSDQIQTFSSPIQHTTKLRKNETGIITFHDFAVLIGQGLAFDSTNSYYIKFEVQELSNSIQDYSIYLERSGATSDNQMSVRKVSVKKGSLKTTIEIIFTPNNSYDTIVFELNRLALDFTQQNQDGTSGRVPDIRVLELTSVANIVKTLGAKFAGLGFLKQMALQATPGQLFILNGEEIRVGRSGIYELAHDIPITYLGFIRNSDSDDFILDFRY